MKEDLCPCATSLQLMDNRTSGNARGRWRRVAPPEDGNGFRADLDEPDRHTPCEDAGQRAAVAVADDDESDLPLGGGRGERPGRLPQRPPRPRPLHIRPPPP